MKNITKILLLALFAQVGLYAGNADLEKFFKNRGYDAKIVYSKDSGLLGLQFVIAEQRGFWIPFLADSKKKILIGVAQDMVISDDKEFSKALEEIIKQVREHNQKSTDNAVIDVFKKYSQMSVKLEGANPKNTTYIVLDANCPYCKDEIKNLDSYLKQGNVELMIVGVLGVDSAKKAATFYANIKHKKSQSDKLAYIKSVFEPSFKADSNSNAEGMMSVNIALSEAGLRGVPYIIKR